jgi:NTE family protein
VRELIKTVATTTGHQERWPTRPNVWIAGTDYLTGQRVIFGRDPIGGSAPDNSEPAVSLADAVVASCSIPAWYPPVLIGSRPYIDGGATSNTSIDLLHGLSFDEVYVLAPMASVRSDRPRSPVARIERAIRRSITRGLLTEVQRLRTSGTRVILVTPGPEDLALLGANLMNPRRRSEVLETSVRTAAFQVRSQLAARDIGHDGVPASPSRCARG